MIFLNQSAKGTTTETNIFPSHNTFGIRDFPRNIDISSFPVPWKKRQITAFIVGSKLQLSQERYYKTDFWLKKTKHTEISLLSVVEIYDLGLCVKKNQWKL